ncbi:MAG: outer membrane protein assembly factor BamE [Alphaproteobacteria bacterium]|nr:outer membrane protein assembly factor BamE [Alphaproteobacteria bacterium]
MKKQPRIMKGLCLAAAATLTLAACAPTTATRGNYVENYRLERIQPGVHTRSDLLQIIGSPTTTGTFDSNTWYYLGQHTEKKGIFDPRVVDERIIVVAFGPDGTVSSVKEQAEGRTDVPIVERTTPTHGNDITMLQQFLGNLGKFNPQEEPAR